MAAKKKPKGWRKFDELTKSLIQVPKEEADAQIKGDKKARAKKRTREAGGTMRSHEAGVGDAGERK